MMSAEPIAERTIYAVTKEGDGFEVRLAIGRPYRVESGDWACPLALDGLHERLHDIHGVDSWQAMMLAVRLIKVLLGFVIENGGKLYWEKGGEEVSFNTLFLDEERGSAVQVPQPDDPLTPEQQEQIKKLSDEDLIMVDKAILSTCRKEFRKVARVVGKVMNLDLFPDTSLPDTFYAQRVYALVKSGKLVYFGHLGHMGSCEVRLP